MITAQSGYREAICQKGNDRGNIALRWKASIVSITQQIHIVVTHLMVETV
jgi:hypothetical protein